MCVCVCAKKVYVVWQLSIYPFRSEDYIHVAFDILYSHTLVLWGVCCWTIRELYTANKRIWICIWEALLVSILELEVATSVSESGQLKKHTHPPYTLAVQRGLLRENVADAEVHHILRRQRREETEA